MGLVSVRLLRRLSLASLVAACLTATWMLLPVPAWADATTPTGGSGGSATPAPSTPTLKGPPSATPPTPPPPSPGVQLPAAPPTAKVPATPDAAPPRSKPTDTEIEPNGSPGVPQNATTESVDVPARTIVLLAGKSSYDEAFKSIKASLDTLKGAMQKAGLKPSGHPLTIFSEPDDKGFKYQSAVPIAAKPDGTPDLGAGVTIGQSPSGKAIKFQHRGAYEDIDSTYDVITAYLDAKGLQVDNPYIEEYLTDLTTPDDPNLQVDIYVFVKK